MKIAIEEILTSMDLAAAKALASQKLNLQYADLNLGVKNQKESGLLVISGNTLIIEPQILRIEPATVDMKITVRQKNGSGLTTTVLTTQLTFVRIPTNSFFTNSYNDGQATIFTTLSAN